MAWLALVVGVFVYEAQAPRHEMLSYALKRYSRNHPWLVRFAVLATALHLLDLLPVWFDPWVLLYLIRIGIEKLIARIRAFIDSFRDLIPLLEVLMEAA